MADVTFIVTVPFGTGGGYYIDGVQKPIIPVVTGGTLASQQTSLDGSVAIVNFANLSFTGVTLTARGALLYNDTESDKAVAVLDFGADKTATSGTFTIQFPAFTSAAAILRIA